jgi:hypothetical protein
MIKVGSKKKSTGAGEWCIERKEGGEHDRRIFKDA